VDIDKAIEPIFEWQSLPWDDPGWTSLAPESTRRQPIDIIGFKKWLLETRFREQEPTPQSRQEKG
jgi:hypothetical protein